MEVFVSLLFLIMDLKEFDGEKFGEFVKEFNFNIQNGNKVLRKIYYIYWYFKFVFGFEILNWENVQCSWMLDEMFMIRYVIVYFGGEVRKLVYCEWIGRIFRMERGVFILFLNLIDDFIYCVMINFNSFIKRMDFYVVCFVWS